MDNEALETMLQVWLFLKSEGEWWLILILAIALFIGAIIASAIALVISIYLVYQLLKCFFYVCMHGIGGCYFCWAKGHCENCLQCCCQSCCQDESVKYNRDVFDRRPLNNRANQLNPNNESFWKSRGHKSRPATYEHHINVLKAEGRLEHRANVLGYVSTDQRRAMGRDIQDIERVAKNVFGNDAQVSSYYFTSWTVWIKSIVV